MYAAKTVEIFFICRIETQQGMSSVINSSRCRYSEKSPDGCALIRNVARILVPDISCGTKLSRMPSVAGEFNLNLYMPFPYPSRPCL